MGNKAAFFVTCLSDLLRPQIAVAAIKVLRQSGLDLVVPKGQTCCGQPAYNGGDQKTAITLAKRHIALFDAHDIVIVPSASCAGMMKIHYPKLLRDEGAWAGRAEKFAQKIYEFSQYLARETDVTDRKKSLSGSPCAVTIHDSCSALREMKITDELRKLLGAKNHTIREAENREACCGFGGAFSVKFPAISNKMAEEKLAALQKSGATTVTSCDFGCLLHLQGTADAKEIKLEFRHIAEILADD